MIYHPNLKYKLWISRILETQDKIWNFIKTRIKFKLTSDLQRSSWILRQGRDAGEGGLRGQCLLPFDRRGEMGQSTLFIKVPLKPAICNNQRGSYDLQEWKNTS